MSVDRFKPVLSEFPVIAQEPPQSDKPPVAQRPGITGSDASNASDAYTAFDAESSYTSFEREKFKEEGSVFSSSLFSILSLEIPKKFG